MPRKQQQNVRAQGGGRKPNSEPKLQVFRDFRGMDLQQSNRVGFDNFQLKTKHDTYDDQTDLQMTYLFLQNNVDITPTGGLEVRPNIVQIFRPPRQLKFLGPVYASSNRIFAARNDYNIAYSDLNEAFGETVSELYDTLTKTNNKGSGNSQFTSIDYYGNMLIACTQTGEVWIGDNNTSVDGMPFVYAISNTAQVSNPSVAPGIPSPKGGGMSVSTIETSSDAFRIKIAYTYVNRFGPTKLSPSRVFYCNYPMTEWNAKRYVRISGSVPANAGVKAVEIYYATDNASFGADTSMLFLGRVDIAAGDTTWAYDCYGYMDATNMWPMANLQAPSSNFTGGPDARYSTNIDGRLYFYGVQMGVNKKPYRLYIGGNPNNLLSVSPGTGGGFVDVEPGTGRRIQRVLKYKTQAGSSIVTLMCSGLNTSKDERFNLVENTITMSNEQSMKSWQAEQVAGAVGCESEGGAIVCVDGLYSINRYGLALTTMTMEYNSQIQTSYVSDAIKPIFKNVSLADATILEIDGIIYLSLGNCNYIEDTDVGNMIFCYDIEKKAWWSYSLPSNSGYVRNLFKIDDASYPEGLGIVTDYGIYYFPTAKESFENEKYDEDEINHDFLIETAQISTQMPQQGWQYLSQLEFHFDYFVGSATIEVRMIDMFGRKITVKKTLSEATKVYDYVVHMRIDQRVMSYVITMSGRARFRMTHFIGRVYTLSDKIGQVWGFDDSISHRSAGDIQGTITCYNDVRRAIFT